VKPHKSGALRELRNVLSPVLEPVVARVRQHLQGARLDPKAIFRKPTNGRQKAQRGQSVTIFTESGDKRNYWSVSEASISQLEDPIKNSVILSLSDQDLSHPAAKKLTHRQLNRLVRSELGPGLRVLNEAKSLGMVFATDADRVSTHTQPLVSGVIVLATLLKQRDLWHRPEQQPIITGFAFGNDEDRLLALYLYDGKTLSMMQVTPRTPDTRGSIDNYIKTVTKERPSLNGKGLRSDDSDRVVLFELEDVAHVLPSVRVYPSEGDWYGVPHSQALHYGRLAALGVLGATTAYAGSQYLRLQYNMHEKAQLIEREQSATVAIRKAAAAHPDAFIKLGSVIPVDRALEKAQAIYKSPGRVILDVKREEIRLLSILDIPAGVAWGLDGKIPEQLAAEAPEECSRLSVETNTSISQLTVTYVCSQPNSDLVGLFAAGR